MESFKYITQLSALDYMAVEASFAGAIAFSILYTSFAAMKDGNSLSQNSKYGIIHTAIISGIGGGLGGIVSGMIWGTGISGFYTVLSGIVGAWVFTHFLVYFE
jgi:hypothetical protein